jgi:hypothetical protein
VNASDGKWPSQPQVSSGLRPLDFTLLCTSWLTIFRYAYETKTCLGQGLLWRL